MKAIDVSPAKWQDIKVIYDDGEYSVMWGKYEEKTALGARWNGDDDSAIGYPNQGSNPTWYVEPDFIAIGILQRLNDMYSNAMKSKLDLEHQKQILSFWNFNNLEFAIRELTNRISK